MFANRLAIHPAISFLSRQMPEPQNIKVTSWLCCQVPTFKLWQFGGFKFITGRILSQRCCTRLLCLDIKFFTVEYCQISTLFQLSFLMQFPFSLRLRCAISSSFFQVEFHWHYRLYEWHRIIALAEWETDTAKCAEHRWHIGSFILGWFEVRCQPYFSSYSISRLTLRCLASVPVEYQFIMYEWMEIVDVIRGRCVVLAWFGGT